ncbi:MAG: sigma-70 family RNA polymerase sigma factor [Phycisphaeraceae bacterium]|nr:sigma-70 family RNA polymerase sigma factor [Phycisphaerae bacterium]MBX3391284.1 sigma-70 family RNA polymerase sigma factor [Phycisphaeraceae bacterium]HRJ49450.1 sigma-70 family RNA polymerase sigma factor [Phycisphaerales bacterium]
MHPEGSDHRLDETLPPSGGSWSSDAPGLNPAPDGSVPSGESGVDSPREAALYADLYVELRHLAASMLSRERRDHTLQPTALVHEAYLKLSRQDPTKWSDRNHYLALAAMAMRRILADHGRAQKAAKRGGGAVRSGIDRFESSATAVPGDPAAPGSGVNPVDLAELLDELERLNPRHARLVELRFYAGLTMPQAAEIMGISVPTAERDWRTAKAWLRSRLDDDST